jgi:hypothetical protein
VSHGASGSFSSRIAPLRKSRAAENIGAGFLTFKEMLKQWEDSTGHRENLLLPGRRRLRRQPEIAVSQILGHGDYGLVVYSSSVASSFETRARVRAPQDEV